jgi:predicted nucleic acid-binding protein
MAVRYVVDTNLLVYALDRREPEKRERAREVLRRVGGDGTAGMTGGGLQNLSYPLGSRSSSIQSNNTSSSLSIRK